MKEFIQKINKRKTAVAIFVTAVLFVVTALAVFGEGMDVPFLGTAVLLSVLAGIFVLLPISYGWILSGIAYLVLPFAAFTALENYTHVLSDLDVPIIVLNYVIFLPAVWSRSVLDRSGECWIFGCNAGTHDLRPCQLFCSQLPVLTDCAVGSAVNRDSTVRGG